jgi:hypothetical protein
LISVGSEVQVLPGPFILRGAQNKSPGGIKKRPEMHCIAARSVTSDVFLGFDPKLYAEGY